MRNQTFLSTVHFRLTALSALPWLALPALIFLTVACATSGVNRGDLNLISLRDEWELGSQLEGQVGKKVRLVHDQRALDYLNQVGRRIVAQTELADVPWEFHLVADPQVNAFNIPGGHVYVNTGLAAAASDVAEFVGVLSHEIAHGVARHATEQMTRGYGLSLLAGAALGNDPGTTEQLAAQILGGGALAKFSRDAEREADRLGVRYMYEAGYNPYGMARMFEILLQKRRSRPGAVGRFFSSHPLTEARIEQVRREAAKLPGASGLTDRDSGYRQFRNRLSRYNR